MSLELFCVVAGSLLIKSAPGIYAETKRPDWNITQSGPFDFCRRDYRASFSPSTCRLLVTENTPETPFAAK
jgi:hypothetical protein